MIQAMSTELFLDFIGIRVDSKRAEGMEFTINLITPDNGEEFAVEMSNATLTNIEGFTTPDPDLTITINRSDLEQTMMGLVPLVDQIANGVAQTEGDLGVLDQLRSVLVQFEMGFEMMPGTKQPGAKDAPMNPFAIRGPALTGE
jgi:alkyl sulfatase BDS1-like metallo-beta-lactamase superfamily hydrolase